MTREAEVALRMAARAAWLEGATLGQIDDVASDEIRKVQRETWRRTEKERAHLTSTGGGA